jgi:phosphate transport system substrate-binding protein
VRAETLRVGGIGAASPMLPLLFAEFPGRADITLDVIPSLGSNGGLLALADGTLDMAVSGHALNPKERAAGLREALEIRTPFTLVTSLSRPSGFKSPDIAEIYKAEKATWTDGSLIRIILRPRSDSDSAVLARSFPGMEAALETARRRSYIPLAATDQDNADLAERVPGSLATSSLTQMTTEGRNLRFVSIDGAEPSLENLETGVYPFAKAFYFILTAKKNPTANRFLAFLRSPAGRAALRATGSILIENERM